LTIGLAWQMDWLGWLQARAADYRTGIGEQRTVRLADGSMVLMNTDSAIDVSWTDRQRTIRVIQGEALFTVSPDRQRPFIVHSGRLRATALGTAFIVRRGQIAVTLTVTEHAVAVSDESSPTTTALTLQEGEQVSFSAETGLGSAQPVNLQAITAWQRGKLIVESQPLGIVVEELNRYRRGRIVILNPSLKRLKVTGVFDLAQPDSAVQLIRRTLPVSLTQITPLLILLH
jgi:transmembrane sensor